MQAYFSVVFNTRKKFGNEMQLNTLDFNTGFKFKETVYINPRLPRLLVDQVTSNAIVEDIPKSKVNGTKVRKILAAYLLILAGGYLHFFLSFLLPPQTILSVAVVLFLIGLIPYILLLSTKNGEPK